MPLTQIDPLIKKKSSWVTAFGLEGKITVSAQQLQQYGMFLKLLTLYSRYTIWKWRKCRSPVEIAEQTEHTLRVHRNLKKEAECGGGIGVRTAKTFLGNVLMRVSRWPWAAFGRLKCTHQRARRHGLFFSLCANLHSERIWADSVFEIISRP